MNPLMIPLSSVMSCKPRSRPPPTCSQPRHLQTTPPNPLPPPPWFLDTSSSHRNTAHHGVQPRVVPRRPRADGVYRAVGRGVRSAPHALGTHHPGPCNPLFADPSVPASCKLQIQNPKLQTLTAVAHPSAGSGIPASREPASPRSVQAHRGLPFSRHHRRGAGANPQPLNPPQP